MYFKIVVGFCFLAHLGGTTSLKTKVKLSAAVYNKSQVWRSQLDEKQLELFKTLEKRRVISIWNIVNSRVDYLVQQYKVAKLQRILRSWKITNNVLIKDVQLLISQLLPSSIDWSSNLRNGYTTSKLNWFAYPSLKNIDDYLDILVKRYPICKLRSLGTTAQNRSIKMLTISNKNPGNDVIIVQAGTHAREWIGVAALVYIITEIVTNFPHQPEYIRNKDWYIIPVLNPDGYEYTHTKDRLWRKNRKVYNNGCVGVDVNRNFGSDFLGNNRETNPCFGSYSGPHPYSEAESTALHELITSMTTRPKAFVDLHSYGQLILYPWASKGGETRDTLIHKKMAEGMVQAIKKVTEEAYNHGQTHHLIHPSSGVALDWVYTTGIRHAYVIETRGTGKHGFLLPENQIEDTGKELFSAISYLAQNVNSIF